MQRALGDVWQGHHVADFPVNVMCEALGVSRSGYYGWASRAESARAAADRALAAEIRAAHAAKSIWSRSIVGIQFGWPS
ncbi:MAG TPA: hypothetical protein VGN83_20880 [Falsiroseomonas sp.]|nr:hypothetical protein [Falsiroseomonas sp.]